jgi:CRP/FNR family transcriptional regulator, cyclic AMP receptor protein
VISRFEGQSGLRVLVDQLCRQESVVGNRQVAELLAAAGTVEEHEAGATIIAQDDDDNSVCFLLRGEVEVRVNGRYVATRRPGQQFGEMAAIDPAQPRSATIKALKQSVVLCVPEPALAQIADQHPELWRNLARSIGQRLRQRGEWVRPANARPRIFVACSIEAIPLARAIQCEFHHDEFEVEWWGQGAFTASGIVVEDLERMAVQVDFAILILRADDETFSRGETWPSPRDNVVFELGLFMGTLGRNRVFIVKPRGVVLKLPSDLLGIIPVDFDPAKAESNAQAALGPACEQIRKAVRKEGTR